MYAALAVLVGLILIATPLAKFLMATQEGRPITWAQALLFVIETITTVGYGGLSPFETIWMNLFSTGLIVIGFSLVFYLVATLAAHWVEERVSPRPPRNTDLEGHVVLTGMNDLVEKFVEILYLFEVPYILISDDEDEAIRLYEEGHEVVLGEPDDPDALDRANLGDAEGLVACRSDAENIGATLAARSLSDLPIVALIEKKENRRYPMLAGADEVVMLKRAMGRSLVDWTLAVPTPAEWPPPIRVEEGAEVIEELNPSVFYITEGSPLADMKVRDVGGQTEALIVGLWKGGELILNPDPDTEVLGTALIAVGSEKDVEELAELASEEEGRGSVVIAGFGDVGAEAYERLKDSGSHPKVIDVEDKGVPEQFVGDATSMEVLEEAGVGEAENFVIALNDDNASIQTALESRFLNPSIHLSARVMSEGALPKFLWAGVEHPISMPTVSTRMLLQSLVRLEAVEPPFDAIAAHRDAGEMAGEPLRAGDIRKKTGALVVGIARDGEVLPAHGGELVQEADELVLIGTPAEVERFDDLFGEEG